MAPKRRRNYARTYTPPDEKNDTTSKQAAETVSVDDTQMLQWEINYLTQLPLEVGFCADSQDFEFLGCVWSIQTYPNGTSENDSDRWICLILRRTGAHSPTRRVLFELGIQDNYCQSIFKAEEIWKTNDLELGPIKLLPLSEACKSENNFLIDDTIKLLCRTSIVKTGTDETETSEISSNILGQHIVGRLSKKELSKDLEHFCWEIPDFSEISEEVGYYLVSPAFKYQGRTCCMRLYTNGRCEYGSEREYAEGIHLMLETSRSSDCNKQCVTCEIGIKGLFDNHTGAHNLEEHENVLGPIKLFSRRCIKNYVWRDDTVTVFCNMQPKRQFIRVESFKMKFKCPKCMLWSYVTRRQ